MLLTDLLELCIGNIAVNIYSALTRCKIYCGSIEDLQEDGNLEKYGLDNHTVVSIELIKNHGIIFTTSYRDEDSSKKPTISVGEFAELFTSTSTNDVELNYSDDNGYNTMIDQIKVYSSIYPDIISMAEFYDDGHIKIFAERRVLK